MVMKAIQQLLHEVDWGGLDILVLDLPPGTGDTQLTITQQVILDGESTSHHLRSSSLTSGRLGHCHNTTYSRDERCNQRHQHVQDS